VIVVKAGCGAGLFAVSDNAVSRPPVVDGAGAGDVVVGGGVVVDGGVDVTVVEPLIG
jgi:hypothetical protein